MNIKVPERKYIALLVGVVLLVSLVLFLHFRNAEMIEKDTAWVDSIFQEEKTGELEQTFQTERVEIVIDVKGAIQHPGVYELSEGSRVYELVDKAGGFLPEADENQLNLSQILHDEMMIYVPVKGEEVQLATNQNRDQDGKVPINDADATMLEQLPGIGPAKAQAIISHREEHGPFKEVEDLLQVSGIGPKSLEQLRDLVNIR